MGATAHSNSAPVQSQGGISAEGGEPQYLGLEMEGLLLYGLSIHPDGQRIAFTAGRNLGHQTWVMENVLPELKAAK